MTLRYWIRGQDQNLVEITDRMRFGFDAEEKLEEGSVAVNTFVIDDIDASLTLYGHRIFAVEETEAEDPENRFIFVGYIGVMKIIRGPYRTGVSRQWQIEVADLNTVLNRRVMVGTGNKRPDETDVERVQWVESTHEGELIDDDRYLSTGSPVNMDDVDYLLQQALDVYNDVAQQSGKNYGLTYFGDVGVDAQNPWGFFSLWYDFAGSDAYPSAARLTNLLADVDQETTFHVFYPDENALTIDPMRIKSTVIVPYKSSYVTAERNSTRLAYARLDEVMNAPNVRRKTTADARASRYVKDLATPDYRATLRTIVPRAKVNAIRPGMNVQVKMTHWVPPFDTTYTYMRVLSRRVVEVSEDDDQTYEELFELSWSEEPTVGAAHAHLYHPHGPYSTDVRFGGTGDDPPPGKPSDPTTGPITILDNGGDFAPYYAIRFDGDGTVDFTLMYTLAGVRNRAKTYTIQAYALLHHTGDDPLQVGSGAVAVLSDGTGLAYYGESISFEATDVDVVDTDYLTFHLACTPGMAFFRTPKGTDSGSSGVDLNGSLT